MVGVKDISRNNRERSKKVSEKGGHIRQALKETRERRQV
jgi:hypothetical protein